MTVYKIEGSLSDVSKALGADPNTPSKTGHACLEEVEFKYKHASFEGNKTSTIRTSYQNAENLPAVSQLLIIQRRRMTGFLQLPTSLQQKNLLTPFI